MLVAGIAAVDIGQADIIMPRLGIPANQFNQFVWKEYFTRVSLGWTLSTLLLTAGGLVREHVLGTSLYSLSLPISRQRWLAIRTGMAFGQSFVLALVPAVVIPTVASLIGRSYSPWNAMKFSLLLFLTGLATFAVGILCSSLLQSEYAAVALGIRFCVPLRHARQYRRLARGVRGVHYRATPHRCGVASDKWVALVGDLGQHRRRRSVHCGGRASSGKTGLLIESAQPLLGVAPVVAGAEVHHQRHRQLADALHLLRTSADTASSSSGGHSNTSSSWTCSSILRLVAASSAASMRTIASLIRSAAVPCRGEFTAVRSAKPRAFGLRLLISGNGPLAPEQRPGHARAPHLGDGLVDETPHARRSARSSS